MLAIAILALLVAVGQTIQTITGFGSNALALSIGAHIYPINSLIVVLVTLSTVQVYWLALRNFSKIQWHELLARIFPACAIGMPIGMLTFYKLNVRYMKLLLGVFIVATSLAEIYRLSKQNSLSSPLQTLPALTVLLTAGFIHGAFATGGPLVVYYSSRQINEKGAFRATMAMLWVVLDTILMISYLISGRLNVSTFRVSAYLFPALLVGIIIGENLHERVEELTFKKIVQFVLLLAGFSLFVR